MCTRLYLLKDLKTHLFDSFKPGAWDANWGRRNLGITQGAMSTDNPEHNRVITRGQNEAVSCHVTHHVRSINKSCAVSSAA